MTVLAHGIGGRQDLPIPFSFLLVGSAAAVLVGFLAAVLLWRLPRIDADAGRPVPGAVQRLADAPALSLGARALGLAGAAYLCYAALAGASAEVSAAAEALYVLFWVGLVPVSLVLGPVWTLLNPARTVVLALSAAARLELEELSPPRRLGLWPAAATLLAFAELELVLPGRTSTFVVLAFLAAYGAVQVLGALVFGVRWLDRADGFEVWSRLLGALAPIGRRSDGRLVVRWPLVGVAGIVAEPGLLAVVSVLLGATAWDALSSTQWYVDLVSQQPGVGGLPLGSAGLVAAVALVALTLWAGCRAGAALGRAAELRAEELAGAVVPIAAGYAVAHYFSLLVFEGQRALGVLAHPRADPAPAIDYTVVTPRTIAVVQVLAVVTGHVAGVLAAHDRALRLLPRRGSVVGQLPLLAVMVGYTVAGLLLLFSG